MTVRTRPERDDLKVVKDKIEDAILNKLDAKALIVTSNTARVADLGCAVGPNTFGSMRHVMNLIEKFMQSRVPEFIVFFNDLLTNYFNALYRSMPSDRQYFLRPVPRVGSTGGCSPESSIHVFHCAMSLHWLSQAPEELLDKSSRENWNKGRIHHTGAPHGVVEAYGAQFIRDMAKFLDARGKEIVVGGQMVTIMAGIPDGMSHDL